MCNNAAKFPFESSVESENPIFPSFVTPAATTLFREIIQRSDDRIATKHKSKKLTGFDVKMAIDELWNENKRDR